MSRFVNHIGEGARFPFEIRNKKEVKEPDLYTYCNYKKNRPKISVQVCKGCKILVCGQNPKNEGVKKMGNEKETRTVTLQNIMDRFAVVESLAQTVIERLDKLELSAVKPAAKPAAQMPTEAVEERMSRKMSKEQKLELRIELTKGIPYTKEQLLELGTKKMRVVGSCLGINTFGTKPEPLLEAILAEQAKKAGKVKDASPKKAAEKKAVEKKEGPKKTAQKAKK